MNREYLGLPVYIWLIAAAVGGGLVYWSRNQKPMMVKQSGEESSADEDYYEDDPLRDSMRGINSAGVPIMDGVQLSPHITLENELQHNRPHYDNALNWVPAAPNMNTVMDYGTSQVFTR